MYIKEIYDNWKLHKDATNLEIRFKFFISLIKILNVKELLYNELENENIISDLSIVTKWKTLNIEKLINEFKMINEFDFVEDVENESSNIQIKTMYIIKQLFFELKKANYKSSEVDVKYEPIIFKLAKEIFNSKQLERWCSTFFTKNSNGNYNNLSKSLIEYDWRIYFRNNYELRTMVWYFENMLLNLKETSDWFTNLSKSNQIDRLININIMNHLIVYALTDFYIKYYREYYKASKDDIYEIILYSIDKSIEERTFASSCYQAISELLNYLILSKRITENDSMIQNFIRVIESSCSQNNQNKFKNIIFDLKNSKSFELEREDNTIKIDKTKDINQEECSEKKPDKYECEITIDNHKTNKLNFNDIILQDDIPMNIFDLEDENDENSAQQFVPTKRISQNRFTSDFSFINDEEDENGVENIVKGQDDE
ncbi:MAG: hypothetical protein ACRC42_02260 [Mycoplasma sp.]